MVTNGVRLTSPPILAYPDFNHQFTVATDASGTALGAVLSQVIVNKERVIAYWSRQLNKAERNYSTVEREALAVVCAVKEFFPYPGHLGVHKTFEKVKDRYFWPGYEKDILHLVEKCEPCQRRNQPAPTPQAPLGTITSTYPFQKISWDIMGPLPVTKKGSKYILVNTNLFSKWVEAFPLNSTNSVTLAEILTDTVICRYGVPEVIHSDQGANFVSEVIQTLCLNLGITRTQTTAYHAQGNGQVEQFNRTLESIKK